MRQEIRRQVGSTRDMIGRQGGRRSYKMIRRQGGEGDTRDREAGREKGRQEIRRQRGRMRDKRSGGREGEGDTRGGREGAGGLEIRRQEEAEGTRDQEAEREKERPEIMRQKVSSR